MLKAHGFSCQRLKLKYGRLLSSFAFRFDLRTYNKGPPHQEQARRAEEAAEPPRQPRVPAPRYQPRDGRDPVHARGGAWQKWLKMSFPHLPPLASRVERHPTDDLNPFFNGPWS